MPSDPQELKEIINVLHNAAKKSREVASYIEELWGKQEYSTLIKEGFLPAKIQKLLDAGDNESMAVIGETLKELVEFYKSEAASLINEAQELEEDWNRLGSELFRMSASTRLTQVAFRLFDAFEISAGQHTLFFETRFVLEELPLKQKLPYIMYPSAPETSIILNTEIYEDINTGVLNEFVKELQTQKEIPFESVKVEEVSDYLVLVMTSKVIWDLGSAPNSPSQQSYLKEDDEPSDEELEKMHLEKRVPRLLNSIIRSNEEYKSLFSNQLKNPSTFYVKVTY